MAVEDRPPRDLPDGAGVAAMYREWAKEASQASMVAYRSQRRVTAAQYAAKARLLNRAAKAEIENPIPDGLQKQLPPGDPPKEAA